MAKSRRHAIARLPRLLPLAAALLLALPAHAQWDVTPAVGLLGTWTDNINLREDDLARSQFVTELRPSLSVTGKSRRLNVNAVANWQQYAYSDKEAVLRPSDSQRSYAGNLQGTLVDQLLYVDASASRTRRNIQPFGPTVEDNPFSLENKADIESWRISPYLVRRFGRDATMQLRYSRDAVDSSGQVNNMFGNSTSDTVLFNLASGTELRTLGWGLNYVRQEIDNRLVGDSGSENLTGSLRYQFSRAWAATATAGYDKYDFEGPGGDSEGKKWTVGGVWTPSPRTSVQASIGRQQFGKTGSLAATVRSRRTAIDVQYSDAITSSRSQFSLPAAIDTAAMLDRLFNTTVADPVERERLVAAYIQANGLPPSLAESINFLSNRWARQKELRASVAWRGGRSTALLSAYRSERVALSDQQSDSPLLGTELTSLSDNLRQRGVNANLSYRMGPRSDLSLGADYSFTESITTGVESTRRTLYARVNRELGRYLSGNLELRRRSGATSYVGRGAYTENALVAQLTMTY